MMETNHVEWKREYTEELKKTLIAFANTDGGELIIGIADDGSVYGITNPDQVVAQISNMLRDSITPDITLITNTQIEFREGKPILHVKVNRGAKRPYFITKKGMTSAGVYVRQGNTSAPASTDAIRLMIRETDQFSYESGLSFDQALTFDYCSRIFQEKEMRFEKTQKQTLKLMSQEGLYTNLGFLLSDQCSHCIQFACFQGIDIGKFVERQRFTGSVLKQLDEAYAALSRYNRTQSEIVGLHRLDRQEYPEGALREALVNSIVHRDYEMNVGTNIRVFDDRIEIASFGGLPPNTTIDTFLLGLSMPRNRNLADIFYRLELIEAFGSGIPKMTDLYQSHGKEIVFKNAASGFMVSLPSLFAKSKSDFTLHDFYDENTNPMYSPLYNPLTDQDNRIDSVIQYVRGHGVVSRSDLEFLLNLGRTATSQFIKKQLASGVLSVKGAGKNTRYYIR